MVAATILPTGNGVEPPMHKYNIDAKVDIAGQCSSLVSHVEYGTGLASSVVFDLQPHDCMTIPRIPQNTHKHTQTANLGIFHE